MKSKRLHTIITGLSSKIVIAIVQFLAIKMITSSLGIENYAIFAILTGMIGWYMLAEIGLGPVLQNYVSKMRVKEKNYSNTLTASFVLISTFWLLFILVLFILKDILGEALLGQFVVNSFSKGTFFFLVSSLYTSSVIFSIVYKVLFAEEKGYLSNLLQLSASILGLIGLAIILNTNLVEHKLFFSLFVFILPSVVLPLIIFLQRIDLSHVNINAFAAFLHEVCLKTVFKFWILTFFAMMVVQVDIFIISQLSSSLEVTTYVIVSKVFTLGYFLYTSYMQMLWPVFSEHLHNSNWEEVNHLIFKNMIIFIFIYLIGFMILYFIFNKVLMLLTGVEDLVVPFNLFIGFVFLTFIRIWTDMYATLLQSINEVDFFIYAIIIQALLSVVLQWKLTVNFGVAGVVYGMLLSYLLTVSWVLPLRYYFLYRKNLLEQKNEK